MIVDELLSQVGLVALVLIVAGIFIALARSRRPGADHRQQRTGRIAQAALVTGLVLVAGVLLLVAALAGTDGRFRF